MTIHDFLCRAALLLAALGLLVPSLPSLPASAREDVSRPRPIVVAQTRSKERKSTRRAEPRPKRSDSARKKSRKTEPKTRREGSSAKQASKSADRDRRTSAQAMEKAVEEEALVSAGIVSKEQLVQYADDPAKLELLEQVYSEAAELGIDDPAKVKGYQDRAIDGGTTTLEEVRQEMVADGLGLPEAALEQDLSATEMLDIVGTIGELGGTDLVDLGSSELWGQIGAQGPGSVYTDILIEGNGLPDDLGGLTAGAILEGMGAIGGVGGNYADGANWDLYAKLQSGEITMGDFQSGVADNAGGGNAGGFEGTGTRPDGSPDAGIPGASPGGGSDASPDTGTSPGNPSTPGSPTGGSEAGTPGAGDPAPGSGATPEKDEAAAGETADATPGGGGSEAGAPEGDAGQTPGAEDAGEGPSIVGKESYDIGGATWVTTTFSTGDYVMNLVDNKTGEVLETREGKVQTLPEGETVEGESGSGEGDAGEGGDSSGGDAEAAEAEEPPDEYTPGPDGEGMTPEQQRALAEQMGLTETLDDYIGRKLSDVIFGTQTGSADSTPDPAGGSEGGGTIAGGPDSVVDPGDPENTGLAAPDALSVEQREALLQDEIGGGVTDPAD